MVGAALLASALCASCVPEARDGQFTCSDGECPEAMRCCAGRCRRTCEEPADAGQRDGGSDASMDAGASDAGQRDGGSDASRDPGADGGATTCPAPCGVGQSCGPADACVDDDSLPSCRPCSLDVQCSGGGVCVAEEDTRGRCFPTVAATGCEGPTYTTRADRATTQRVRMHVCLPPPGVSCAAVLAAVNENLCSDDAMCPEGGACDVARMTCSYACGAREDCLEGFVCASGLCSTP